MALISAPESAVRPPPPFPPRAAANTSALLIIWLRSRLTSAGIVGPNGHATSPASRFNRLSPSKHRSRHARCRYSQQRPAGHSAPRQAGRTVELNRQGNGEEAFPRQGSTEASDDRRVREIGPWPAMGQREVAFPVFRRHRKQLRLGQAKTFGPSHTSDNKTGFRQDHELVL